MSALTFNKNGMQCLSGNALKLIAAGAMLIDHIGMLLLPQYIFLRIIGRLAFPLFAFLIAEGCRYTRSPGRYLGNLLLLGGVCQIGSVFGGNRWELCVPCSFFLGAALLICVDKARKKEMSARYTCIFGLLAAVIAAAALLAAQTVGLDYGFAGALLPLMAGLAHKKWPRLFIFGAGLALLSLAEGGIQFYSLFALPFLALYNSKRGTLPLKWFFYIFYPAHLMLLWGISRLQVF